MKNVKKINKKVNQKVRSTTKTITSKTGSFLKKSKKQAVKTMKALQKEWKKDQPQREEYFAEVKKIGSDVIETIKKDISEISTRKKK